MRKMALLLPLLLFAFDREASIEGYDRIIKIYEARLGCLEHKEALPCIQNHPLDPHSDALAKTFSMSFPKSYYEALLRRNIELLKRQKLCYGKALSEEEAKRCLKP